VLAISLYKIQKDRVMEMKRWANTVKKVVKEEEKGGRVKRKNINLAIVSANNHYAGFGPGTANIFRRMVGLPEAAYSNQEDHKPYLHSSNIQQPDHNSNQSTLSDFMT
jgi:hypothetical protein